MKIELLSPAGNRERLETAFRFGADAVYLAGKNFGLRAFSDNFNEEELLSGVQFAHKLGKKVYVTVNIYAKNKDFTELPSYFQFLENSGADAVIISDPGVLLISKKHAPNLPVHISTQANTLNKYSAEFWAKEGASRIVLARELSIPEISEIRNHLEKFPLSIRGGTAQAVGDIELEAFVHGAMCVAYSGRCLLSNVLTDRDGNRGECAQPCRWAWLEEDGRGTYVLNSKDLNMIAHLDKLAAAGVTSFKIEGRMKTAYYVAGVTRAYREAIDILEAGGPYRISEELSAELDKVSHRTYGTGFYLSPAATENTNSAQYLSNFDFIAQVLGYNEERGEVKVVQKNRFRRGDELEILSPDKNLHGKKIVVGEMFDEAGNQVSDAKLVEQVLRLKTEIKPQAGDFLRKCKEK